MSKLSQHKITNYGLFMAGWLACVWGVALGFPWLGVVVFLPTLLFHLDRTRSPSKELKLMIFCGSVGFVIDGLLLATGWVVFPNSEWIPGLAPYWMMSVWLFLGPTLSLLMSGMKNRLLSAFLLGAAVGPLVYLAGVRLGGIELLSPLSALLALSLGWGIVMPLLVAVTTRLNAVPSPNLPEFLPAK